MIMASRHFINITVDHIRLYNIIKENSKKIDSMNETYKEILDNVLKASNDLIHGKTMQFNHNELIEGVLFEAFGTAVPQYIINEVDILVSNILNYYTYMLIELQINETLLYLDDVSNKGVVITTYDNSHLESIMKEQRHGTV